MELMAKQLVTGSMKGTCPDDATTASRFSTFEIGYNHNHHRKGIELPSTLEVLTKEIRPKGVSDWNIFFETLTHADVSASTAIKPRSGHRARHLGLRHLSRGLVEIVASESGPVEVSVSSLDGRSSGRMTLELAKGESRRVDFAAQGSSGGIRVVRVRAYGETAAVLLPD